MTDKKRWWPHIKLHNNGLYFNPEYGDIICVRHDGKALVNIAQRVVHYSPEGFEWGFGGGGPADLALNILDLYIPPTTGASTAKSREKATKLWDGRYVNDEAFSLHQLLKRALIAPMPRNGGIIRGEEIVEFLSEYGIQWTRDMWVMKGRETGRADSEARSINNNERHPVGVADE